MAATRLINSEVKRKGSRCQLKMSQERTKFGVKLFRDKCYKNVFVYN